jgi:hypothetical protein
VSARAPLELVNWTNEEGGRFRPAMMGRPGVRRRHDSGVRAITDDISVAQALQAISQAGPLTPSPRAACWLEVHIEQGAVMAASNIVLASSPHSACALLSAHGHRRTEPCRTNNDGSAARPRAGSRKEWQFNGEARAGGALSWGRGRWRPSRLRPGGRAGHRLNARLRCGEIAPSRTIISQRSDGAGTSNLDCVRRSWQWRWRSTPATMNGSGQIN